MKDIIAILMFCGTLLAIQGTTFSQATVSNPDFDRTLQRYYSYSVPLIDVDSLVARKTEYLLLDTRTLEEFSVSKIPGARYIGHRRPDYTVLEDVPFDQPIVVYCTVGYRSEKIGEKIREMGYNRVYNLYGSIFEWVNRGHDVVGPRELPTDSIHTYSARWSKWVTEEGCVKVW